jgi:hypothetical protein
MSHRGTGPSRLSYRVIEVTACTPRALRLVQKNGEEGRYACLSYCWGGKQPLRTTLEPDTLSSHQHLIREEDLPKTFHDAITVVINIGLRYLWIDSLCVRSVA